jgi:hypothetical protein
MATVREESLEVHALLRHRRKAAATQRPQIVLWIEAMQPGSQLHDYRPL